jgi:phage terminase Nu1 subunit (DNA packaging protein)
MDSAEVLLSWKEIAAYARVSVRTAQRWASIGMPVSHIGNGPRGTVASNKGQIDRWLKHPRLDGGFETADSALRRFAEVARQTKTLREEMHNRRLTLQQSHNDLVRTVAILFETSVLFLNQEAPSSKV